MDGLFRVAIIGRPNVGKSTLFNRMIGIRKALTFGRPGITRDFITEKVSFQGRSFELIDTGGFDLDTDEELALLIRRQVMRAINESDLLILLFDGKEGISTIDHEIVRMMREKGKEYIVALNKIDHKKYREFVPLLYELGIKSFHEVSAEHGTGVLELMEEIAKRVVERKPVSEEVEPFCRVSIVGRPNVGKSTLINTLTGQERIIASPIPGTTRDSIDMELLLGERKIVLVDTAGIRPRRKTADAVEKIMSIRSIDSIKKSNIAVLVIDAGSGVTHNDQQILRYILKENRGAVIAVNKTDLLGEGSLPEALREVSDAFTFASFVPAVPVSALQGKGMRKLLRAVIGVFDQYVKRVKTSELNRKAEKFLYNVTIPGSRRPNRAYYITQTGVAPPSFAVFVKDPGRVPDSFNRYVANRIRENFDFHGSPLVIRYRQK